eukprot:m.286616 g.286616  ORF g.286616 m.286616 type:complete len:54 (+) comp161258_c0_seq1:151-312(+)
MDVATPDCSEIGHKSDQSIVYENLPAHALDDVSGQEASQEEISLVCGFYLSEK